jgi:hypothetical protein
MQDPSISPQNVDLKSEDTTMENNRGQRVDGEESEKMIE